MQKTIGNRYVEKKNFLFLQNHYFLWKSVVKQHKSIRNGVNETNFQTMHPIADGLLVG